MTTPVRCVFSIGPGRTGSHYLSDLFKHVENCLPLHEAAPVGSGQPMRQYLRGNTAPMETIAKAKAAVMAAVVEQGLTYVETNHIFIKGFGWYMPDYFEEPDIGVVVLERPTDEVVTSTLKINSSPLSRLGYDWTITPEAADPILPPPRSLLPGRATFWLNSMLAAPYHRMGRLHRAAGRTVPEPPGWLRRYEEEVLAWYVEETWARAEAYRRRFPGVRFVTTSAQELSTPEGVDAMLDTFGLTAKPSLADTLGQTTNTDGWAS